MQDVELGSKTDISNQASDLDRHSDPFAVREGKTLTWKNVNMILVSGKERCWTYEKGEPLTLYIIGWQRRRARTQAPR